MAHFKPITHVIFDIDGTLLDTESIYQQVFKDIAAKFGKNDYPIEVRQKILGRKETESAAIFIEEMGLPLTVNEFRELQFELQREPLINANFLPGAERLIYHLKENNIPMALASSSSIESIELKFSKRKELFQLFSHVVSGTSDPEVKEGKPAPDIFLICASRFQDKPNPENCLVFEDAPSGVTAAISANMQVVVVPDEDIDPKKTEHATVVLKSLNDFQPELFNLPPFKSL